MIDTASILYRDGCSSTYMERTGARGQAQRTWWQTTVLHVKRQAQIFRIHSSSGGKGVIRSVRGMITIEKAGGNMIDCWECCYEATWWAVEKHYRYHELAKNSLSYMFHPRAEEQKDSGHTVT